MLLTAASVCWGQTSSAPISTCRDTVATWPAFTFYLPSPTHLSTALLAMSATLQRKVQKVLSSKARFDTPDMIQATQASNLTHSRTTPTLTSQSLPSPTQPSIPSHPHCTHLPIHPLPLSPLRSQGLSALYSPGDNTLDNRRKLRSLLDRRSVHIHHQLVQSFTTINTTITTLHNQLTTLLQQCEQTLHTLHTTKQNNTTLLTQTQTLQAEQALIDNRSVITMTFLEKFQLSDSDIAALEGTIGGADGGGGSGGDSDSGGLDDGFFMALGRIGRIREDCKQLLQSYHQRIGLDILDSLAKRLESGYERLYRYVQSQASQLTSLPAESSAPVVSALALLRSMPVYYEHCLSEIAQGHRLAVIQRFMAAMSRGEGRARPIDVHAHDAVRYVSELLRWVEEAVRSEKDFIDQLMAMIDQQQAMLTSSTPAPSAASPTTPASSSSPSALLASVFEGLARLLRTRIEQALLTQPTPDTSFRLYTLLSSASLPLLSLLPSDAVLSSTIRSLIDTARINFFDTVKKQSDKLTPNRFTPPSDLSPPPVLVEALTQLNSILSAASAVATTGGAVEMAPVLAALLDPLLGALSQSASKLPADEQAVYAINCLHAVLSVLRRYESARGRSEMSALELDAEVEKLVGVQYDAVMDKCGMKAIVERIRAIKQQRHSAAAPFVPLSTLEGLSETAVRQAVGQFYGMLFSVGSFVVPQADRLLQSTLRRSCRESVALSISAAYREVCDSVADEREGYGGSGSGSGGVGGGVGGVRWLQHTSDQVDLLLEVHKGNSTSSGGILGTLPRE